MVLKVIHGVRDQLYIAALKVRLMDGEAPQFGRANGRKVAGMREEHAPPDVENKDAYNCIMVYHIIIAIYPFIYIKHTLKITLLSVIFFHHPISHELS